MDLIGTIIHNAQIVLNIIVLCVHAIVVMMSIELVVLERRRLRLAEIVL